MGGGEEKVTQTAPLLGMPKSSDGRANSQIGLTLLLEPRNGIQQRVQRLD